MPGQGQKKSPSGGISERYQLLLGPCVYEPLRKLALMAFRLSSVSRGSEAFLHSSTFSLRSLSCSLYHFRLCAFASKSVTRMETSRPSGSSPFFMTSRLSERIAAVIVTRLQVQLYGPAVWTFYLMAILRKKTLHGGTCAYI